MNKRWMFWLKLAILLAVVFWLAKEFYKAWTAFPPGTAIHVDWRWGLLATAGFCGSMLTGSLVWRWLAWEMGDRAPTVRLLGAYTFSQMGKYVPGKVVLLLMRLQRSGRYGMSAEICTLATLLENALYMVSGGLVGMVAIAKVTDELTHKNPQYRTLIWPVTVGAVAVLAAACAPPVFYGLVNRLLRRLKRPDVPRAQWLGAGTLVKAVVGFVPCWFFGGLALWASTNAVFATPLLDCWWFTGAFALSVIIGMASLLPGGTGIREALLVAAVTLQLTPSVGHERAFLMAGVVAVLQRVFQVLAEIVLGLCGMAMTRNKAHATAAKPLEQV